METYREFSIDYDPKPIPHCTVFDWKYFNADEEKSGCAGSLEEAKEAIDLYWEEN